MTKVTQDHILSVLKRIAAPDGRGNIVSAGLAVVPIAVDACMTWKCCPICWVVSVTASTPPTSPMVRGDSPAPLP